MLRQSQSHASSQAFPTIINPQENRAGDVVLGTILAFVAGEIIRTQRREIFSAAVVSMPSRKKSYSQERKFLSLIAIPEHTNS